MASPSSLFPGKHFISTILEALETKNDMSGRMTRRYLQRAAMAGIIIGLMYGTNYAVVAGFDAIPAGDTTLHALGRLVGALVFGWALVFIYYTKSELLTSNMMIVSIGVYHRRTTVPRALRLLGLCYLGNVLGGLLIAVLYRFSTLIGAGVQAEMHHAVVTKLAYVGAGATGWVDLLVRAVLCNFMINLAMLIVYNGIIRDDLTRSLVMIMSVFVFAFLSFEHSVANTVLFTIMGLQEGIDLGAAAVALVIALVGNFIGGGLLIGLYYAYVNDDTSYVREHGVE